MDLKQKISKILTRSPYFKYIQLMFLRGSTITLKFVLTLYIARFVGLSGLGAYGLIVALGLIVPVFLRAGFANTIARELIDATPQKIAIDFKSYLLWVGGCYGLILALIPVLFMFEGIAGYRTHALIIWAIVLGEHLATDSMYFLNNLRRPMANNLFGFGQAAALSIPFMIGGILWPWFHTLDVLLICWAIGNFLALFCVSFLFRKFPWKEVGRPKLGWYKHRIKSSGYLFVNDVVYMIGQFMDRYMVAYFIGLEQAGAYTLFSQIANSLLMLVTSGVTQVHNPKIIAMFRANKIEEARASLRHLKFEALGILLCLSIAAGVIFPFVAPYLNQPTIITYLPLLWFMLSAVFVRVYYQVGCFEIFARRLDAQAFALMCCGVTLVAVFSLSSIPLIDIYALPSSIIAAYAIMAVVVHFRVKKQFYSEISKP